MGDPVRVEEGQTELAPVGGVVGGGVVVGVMSDAAFSSDWNAYRPVAADQLLAFPENLVVGRHC
ncbi:hypothetical protein M413DRAFT_449700 [Hebeloma cylindrosporum]|uniref:Uncharacterized protein n=1 Tax=Hebeloma cylindrosporum TaxID=76867 RepID=A0A0C3BFL6_HEBCY|nr:hypothetical protein M413DRAFT_449700 [Hebeloma cylindrosporum h7]